MRTELIKQFVKKTIRKVFIFAFVLIVVSALGQSISPIVTNEIALGQMQNSNEMFMLMDTYNKVRPIINIVYSCVILWFVCTLGRDAYKFAKTINTKNEKEI